MKIYPFLAVFISRDDFFLFYQMYIYLYHVSFYLCILTMRVVVSLYLEYSVSIQPDGKK